MRKDIFFPCCSFPFLANTNIIIYYLKILSNFCLVKKKTISLWRANSCANAHQLKTVRKKRARWISTYVYTSTQCPYQTFLQLKFLQFMKRGMFALIKIRFHKYCGSACAPHTMFCKTAANLLRIYISYGFIYLYLWTGRDREREDNIIIMCALCLCKCAREGTVEGARRTACTRTTY